MKKLDDLLSESTALKPDSIALMDPAGESLTYAELDDFANKLSKVLLESGANAGDRIGICIPKNISAVAAIFGTLRSGMCYVPVDSSAPLQRISYIFSDCSVKAIFVDPSLAEAVIEGLSSQQVSVIERINLANTSLCQLKLEILITEYTSMPTEYSNADLAYILYTSGSTGKPKGVVHSHASALGFIDWCSREFQPKATDRFSSHAPFHFDLSIFDIYVSIKHQASLVLINEELGKNPLELASTISDYKISVWYSTPSILRLLMEFGKIDTLDFSNLRLLFYAGEVFPFKHLKSLLELLPSPEYCNLYGPTETNVCTYHRITKPLPDDDSLPSIIGKVCSGDAARIVNEAGKDVAKDEEGELWISGQSVHLGYWNMPDRNATAFEVDEFGVRWYKTGDIVIELDDSSFRFIGRRDRMVKRRGFRVELGEIETTLYLHENIAEVAVTAKPDPESGVIIRAHVQWSGSQQPSVLAMKRFASENLLSYMVPDRFIFLDELPKTSTDKIDYQKLGEL